MAEAPWRDLDEPDFMPRIRREFGRHLPERLARGRAALDRLSADAASSDRAVEELFAVVHALSGTAQTVGAGALGLRAVRIAGTLSGWIQGVEDVSPSGVAGVREDWGVLEEEAAAFQAWLDAEAGDA